MKIIISHGDKGGVGKSLVAAAAVDTIIASNENAVVALVEGDNTQPDVAPRFKNVDNVIAFQASLNAPELGYERLGEIIGKVLNGVAESGDSTDNVSIVINTPAGFSETFNDEAQGLLKSIVDGFGAKLTILYSVGNTAIAKTGASDFIKNNTTGGETILVLPEYLANAETWNSKFKQFINDGLAFVFPKIKNTVIDIYMANPDKYLPEIEEKLKTSGVPANLITSFMVKDAIKAIRGVISEKVLK